MKLGGTNNLRWMAILSGKQLCHFHFLYLSNKEIFKENNSLPKFLPLRIDHFWKDMVARGQGSKQDVKNVVFLITPVTLRQPTWLPQQTPLKSTGRNRVYGVNTCLGATCHRSNWSVASCSQTGTYSLWLLIDFSSICSSLSIWLSLGTHCDMYKTFRCTI